MTTHHPDPTPPSPQTGELSAPADAKLARAAVTLQRLPSASPGAIDRVVAAAMARNGTNGRRSPRTTWLARAATILAAAGLGAAATLYGSRLGSDDASATIATAASTDSAPTSTGETNTYVEPAAPPPPSIAQTVTAHRADDVPVPTGFALARTDARRVAVIGDFNRWDASATPLTRDARGVWTATVPLSPGRHAYVFVVDDSIWVTDPRAEVVRDPDYGRHQSVIVVGRP